MSNNDSGILDSSVQEMVNQAIEDNEKEQTPQPLSVEDSIEMVDVTRKARQAACQEAQRLLAKSARGYSIDKKEQIKILNQLVMVTALQDQAIGKLMEDMVRTVRAQAEDEAQMTAESAVLRAVILTLEDKGVLTENDIKTTHQEKVIPRLMEEIKRKQAEEDAADPTA